MAHTIGSTKKREEGRCATAEYVFCDYIMSQIKTPKDKAIVTVFIITIIAAVFASTAIVQYLTPKKTTMWVFNDNYKAGTPLSEGMLKSVKALVSPVRRLMTIPTATSARLPRSRAAPISVSFPNLLFPSMM
jgi:hypothetical protein